MKRASYPGLWRDVLIAVSPVAFGFGLAAAIHRLNKASVTTVTHKSSTSL